MRQCSKSHTDQGEVLDDYCYVTSALGTFCSESHIITPVLHGQVIKTLDVQPKGSVRLPVKRWEHLRMI